MNNRTRRTIAVIVAHPDDETLWAGGTILENPSNDWFIVCLSRAGDPDRSRRFYDALKVMKVKGIMGDMEDGPDQEPLDIKKLEAEILHLLPPVQYELIITHDVSGEYTRHKRHEEVNKAVMTLWHENKISTNEVWTFAYEDNNAKYFPKAIDYAPIFETLTESIWQQKYNLITQTYGFEEHSWEAETTPLSEAFWQFKDSQIVPKVKSQYKDDIKLSKLSIFKLLSKTYSFFVGKKDDLELNISFLIAIGKLIIFNAGKKTFKKIGTDLKIFSVPNIDIFKVLYYKSISYVFEKETFEPDLNTRKKPFWEFNTKNSLKQFGTDLKIFTSTNIEALKSSYYESIGIV